MKQNSERFVDSSPFDPQRGVFIRGGQYEPICGECRDPCSLRFIPFDYPERLPGGSRRNNNDDDDDDDNN